MTERDFVLNNFNKYEGIFSKEEINVHLKYIKDLYKAICENTSEESDDSFWLDGYERIRFSEITKVTNLGSEILEVKCTGMFHQLFSEDVVKFKAWFEAQKRKGGK